nr:uncharacterized protein LOC123277908 [Equus asinus]
MTVKENSTNSPEIWLQPPEGTRPGPALRAHTRRALSRPGPAPPILPRGSARAQAGRSEPAPDPPARPPGRTSGLRAGSVPAHAPSRRAPGGETCARAGLRAVLELQFQRDFRASAAFLTSRRAQRCSGWSDTSQRAAVTPDLRLPFRVRAVLPLCRAMSSRFSLFFPSRGIPRRTDLFWQVQNHGVKSYSISFSV